METDAASSPRRCRRCLRPLIFCVVAFVITAVWTVMTDTERVLSTDGEGRPVYSCANVSKMIDGTAATPFVRRRLLPDSARLAAAVVPRSTWTAAARRYLDLLSLYGIAGRHVWWPAAVRVASYSKETDCLVIPAYAVLRRTNALPGRCWTALAEEVV